MELRDYLRVAREHWMGMAAAVLITVSVAAVWTALQPRVYTAQASGYVAAQGATDLGTSMVGEQLAQRRVASYLDIGGWRTVAEYAIGALGLDTTPEKLVEQVEVTNPTDTVILQVSAQAATPEGARDLASAWVEGIIVEVEKIESTGTGEAPVKVVSGESARLPTAPSSPNVRLNLVVGLAAGLLLALGYAVLKDRIDQRVRSSVAVERITGLAVVGSLPLAPGLTKSRTALPAVGKAEEDIALAEAFRSLRSNLQYMNVDDPPRAIVVTSPVPGDGKSFTAANLAAALALSGSPVVLVDGDLRRPRADEIFGLSPDAGLSDVLANRVRVEDILQPAPGIPGLSVLVAGPIPPNPSEILGSERMHQLLSDLRETSFVIIDAPPLLPVTDAAILGTRADGTLLVVRTGSTTFDMLEQSLDTINRVNGRTLGVVMNRVPLSGSGKAAYGYRYGGEYYRRTPTEAKA